MHLYILALQYVAGLSCIFSPPALEATISPRRPDSVDQIMVSRNQDLITRGAHCFWIVTTSRLSQVNRAKRYNKYVHKLIYMSLYWHLPYQSSIILVFLPLLFVTSFSDRNHTLIFYSLFIYLITLVNI